MKTQFLSLLVLFITLILISCSPKTALQTSSSYPINTVSKDKRGNPMLVGLCTKQGLQQAPFSKWYDKYYQEYDPGKYTSKTLKSSLTKDIHIKAFMGTWCGDSKRNVPKFYRVLEEVKFDDSRVTLINMKNGKQTDEQFEKGLNIHRVPTFVVYRGDEEIGRIVEHPVQSIEQDLLKIIDGTPYTHHYALVTRVNELIEEKGANVIHQNASSFIEELKPLARKDNELNTYGYVIQSRGQKEAALAAFKLNTLLFPKVANTYDSLGETYAAMGKTKLAIQNYEKVLEINPCDKHAEEVLSKIREGASGK